MAFFPQKPDDKASYWEKLQYKLDNWWTNKLVPIGARYIHDVVAAQVVLEAADFSKKYRFLQSPDYVKAYWNITDGASQVTRVDIYDRKGYFMDPWLAMYGEKRGKLAKTGEWQHVPCNRETVWTRQEAEAEAKQQKQ